jgi:hypothetical protein
LDAFARAAKRIRACGFVSALTRGRQTMRWSRQRCHISARRSELFAGSLGVAAFAVELNATAAALVSTAAVRHAEDNADQPCIGLRHCAVKGHWPFAGQQT